MKSEAIIVTGANKLELGWVELPELASGELLVKAAYSCVSPGTELRCLSGRGEAGVFPYVPGYAMAGVVVKCGKGTRIPEGTRVFAAGTDRCGIRTQWGAHIAYAVKREAELIVLPDEFELLDASVARLAAISYHGVRFSEPCAGLKVAVAGLGPIGQLSARIHHALGAEVVGGDIVPSRIELLEKCGAKAVNTSHGIENAFKEHFPDGADVVVDATGVPALVPELVKVARDLPWDDQPVAGARYLIQGSYEGDVAIPYQAAFMKEISFHLPRNTQKQDYLAVMQLVLDGKLNLNQLASEIYPPAAAPQAFDRLIKTKEIPGTVVFKWE